MGRISITTALERLIVACGSFTIARQKLIDACAAGTVRAFWHGHHGKQMPYIHIHQWIGAEIDPAGVVIAGDSDRTRMAFVYVEEEDFTAFLNHLTPAPARYQRFNDGPIVDEAVQGIKSGKWPNPLQAANALAGRAQGASRDAIIRRLREKIGEAIGGSNLQTSPNSSNEKTRDA